MDNEELKTHEYNRNSCQLGGKAKEQHGSCNEFKKNEDSSAETAVWPPRTGECHAKGWYGAGVTETEVDEHGASYHSQDKVRKQGEELNGEKVEHYSQCTILLSRLLWGILTKSGLFEKRRKNMQRRLALFLLSLMAVAGTPATAEQRYALMTRIFHCNAATLSRVEEVTRLSIDEALVVIGDENLCIEESVTLTVSSQVLVQQPVEIMKPPASIDMQDAGYLVIIKHVMELAVVDFEA